MIELLNPVSMKSQGMVLSNGEAGPHILLVVDQFPKTLGGGERVLLKLAALLPKYGFRVSVLTFFAHPESTVLDVSTCPIYLLALRKTYDWTAVRGAFAFGKFLRSQRIELVQTFFESSDLWAGLFVKIMSDAKLIWSRRDMGILRGRKHALAYRLMAGLPDAVLAVSDKVRKHCIEVDGIEAERVETVYNGLDLFSCPQSKVSMGGADRVVITTVGNIRRVKGHDLLVRAAARLVPRFPELTFSVAGAVLEPEYFSELETMVNELGLAGRFQFTGAVLDTQSHLCAADVFVLPSRSEGFSNAIIEAMAAGLPVVATDVGGNSEAVEDGVSGVIVPPEDVEALASGLRELLLEPERARSFGAAGREIAARRFSTEAMMEKVTTVYRQLLGTS